MPPEVLTIGKPRSTVMRTVIIGFCVCVSFTLSCVLGACVERTRVSGSAAPDRSAVAATPQGAEALVVPNDNRTPAGVPRENTLELRLEARQVTWRPDNDAANTITVLAFAEEGRRAQIPGPLLRVAQGTEVRITVRNSIPESAHLGLPPKRQREEGMSSTAGPELTVHGLRAGTVQNDTLHIPTGTVREVRFRASKPGTFLYWGAMSRRGLDVRTGNDAQLSGAIVVDPVGTTPDPGERIFVITLYRRLSGPIEIIAWAGHFRAGDQRLVMAAHRAPVLRAWRHCSLAMGERHLLGAPDAPARVPFPYARPG